MNAMIYKGYAASVAYSEQDSLFVGHIAGIRDIIGFHAETVNALRAAFEAAVDDYLMLSAQISRGQQHQCYR